MREVELLLDNVVVPLWQHAWDRKSAISRHKTAAGFGHALLVPNVADTFRVLDVAAAQYNGESWCPIHVAASLNEFEIEHGVESERVQYNHQQWARLKADKKTLVATHAGYHDLFVPVVARGEVVAALVTGPIAFERPTSTSVLERWRALTGRQGHPADPEFAAYLAASLHTLVLDRDQSRALTTVVECLARLSAGEGDADELANRASVARRALDEVRSVERSWEAVRMMLDERSLRSWSSAHRAWGLAELGLARVPDHVLVGLTLSIGPESDPVDAAIRRDAFQRSAVELGRKLGGIIAGRVGDHGVVFLIAPRGGDAHKRRTVAELTERAASIARRRYGLSVHFGAATPTRSSPLSRDFQAALGAAESALTEGSRLRTAAPGEATPERSLRRLRQDLVRAVKEQNDAVKARFDHYLEAVRVQSGYRIELARGHLEAGFERMTESLVASGSLDRRSFDALCAALDRIAARAATLDDLFDAYRRAASDVADALARPVQARQERSLRNAVEYIHGHYAEPLSFRTVARVAGFNATYFSELFRKREHTTFERYVLGLRLERAKQLLTSTDLDVTTIANLSGFGSPNHFHHVFRHGVKQTPLAYRRAAEHETVKNRTARRRKRPRGR